jgi:metal-dependent HD superfamily phosphatase/phosphodiesterase
MSNSAGIFQVEQTIADKIKGGPLEDQVEIIATTVPEMGVKDKRIIYKVTVKNGILVAKGISEKEKYVKY